jgi:WD40 repeat protein
MNLKPFIQIEYKNANDGLHQDVWSLATFDENKIITGSCNGTICVYSVDLTQKTYNLLHLKEKAHNYAAINYILVCEDNLIVSCADDGSIKMWKFESNKNLKEQSSIIKHHTQNVKKVIALKDHDKFVSCSFDRTIKIWEKKSPHSLIYSFKECNRIHSMIELKKYKQKDTEDILIESWGNNPGYITVWDLSIFKRKGNFQNVYTCCPNGLVELKNGRVAVSRYEPLSIIIIDPYTFEIVKTISNSNNFDCIKGQSSLVVTNNGLLIYIWEGYYIKIKDEDDYNVVSFGFKDINCLGWAGLVFLNKETYIVTNNKSNGIGIFTY